MCAAEDANRKHPRSGKLMVSGNGKLFSSERRRNVRSSSRAKRRALSPLAKQWSCLRPRARAAQDPQSDLR